MTLPVKYFSSAQAGAPTLSGTAGSLIALLDACLVNGYGLKSVDSLVVVGNLATATISTGHIYPVDGVVLVAGAAPAGLNGEQRVLSITANTFTFATSGISDQTATGTITAKMAPAGWSKEFSGTNKAVYRSGGNGYRLRVDDTNPTYALVRGYEAMTDVDTGAAPFPQSGQMASGLWWKKSNAADTTQREWRLLADVALVHLFCLWQPAASFRGGGWYTFGDLVSYLTGDTSATLLTGYYANPNNNYESNHWLRISYDQQGKFLARDMAAIVESMPAGHAFITFVDNMSMASRFGPNYPGAIDNGLHIHGPLLTLERTGTLSGVDTTQRLRGHTPGVYQILHNSNMPNTYSMVSGISGLSGRSLLLAPVAFPASNEHGATVAVDITGPWR